MKKVWFVLSLCGAIMAIAQGAQITVPRVGARPGGAVTAEVRFAAQGENVTGIQFDLEYPAELSVTAAIGPAGSDAGKSLTASDVGAGKKRILIAGLNQNALSDGVLLSLSITLPSGPGAAQYALHISNASGTDKGGKSVPVSAVDGGVVLGDR